MSSKNLVLGFVALVLLAGVADAGVGGSAECVDVTRVICYNQTQRRFVSAPAASSWDCEDAGLSVEDGDRVAQYVYGTVAASCASSVGGAATGVTGLSYLRCLNMSTGQRVYPSTGDTTWDCEAAGLAVAAGQSLRMTVAGEAGAVCSLAAGAAIAGPAELYSFCWYLGAGGATCDAVCNDVGGSNLAVQAENAWPDHCQGAQVDDVSNWFYTNGNAGGWSVSTGGTNYHTLGYGYQGSQYYGKCAAGTAPGNGAYPGDPNNNPIRSVVCACAAN